MRMTRRGMLVTEIALDYRMHFNKDV